MIHYCPECIEEQEEIDIETYKCAKCGDTYCTHFIKSIQLAEDFHADDEFGMICWICGSEKLRNR